MDPIRLRMTAAALGAVALATTVLAVASRVNEAPAPATADADDEAVLVERVIAAIDAPAPPTPVRLAAAADMSPGDIEETAAAIATATRLALAGIAQAPRIAPVAPVAAGAEVATAASAATEATAHGFRRVEDAAVPAFVISAADARIAADQGWVAASGLAPVTIELRPRPRSD